MQDAMSAQSGVDERLTARPSRRGPPVAFAFAALGVLFAVYLVAMIGRHDWAFSPLADGWLVVAFQSTACALGMAAGFGPRRHRRVARIMAGACIAWTLGDVIFTLESLGGATPPTPAFSDLFFFAFYPLAFAAVLLFVHGEIRRADAVNWLDGAIAALGIAAICSMFALGGVERQFDHASLASLTNLGVPFLDVALLAVVVGSTIFVTGRRRATLVLIALGISVNAAGDTIFFIQPASGASQFSNVLNAVAWPFSIFVFAMAMWVADRGSSRFALQRLSGFGLPGLIAASSFAILVLDNWHRVAPLTVALAAGALLLAAVRLAFRPALRLARAQLRSSEERYRVLFEENPLPMVTYDRASRRIVAASNALVESYGYSRAELEAMTIDDLRAPAEGGEREPEAADERAADTVRHRRSDGAIIDVEVSRHNVTVGGRDRAIALYNDVTERNRLAAEAALAHERAVEASNMKSAFLANVSHEIRTPMNAVIGMTELLLETALTEDQRTCATQVARSSDQMLALINDILDISKIETGHLELEIDDFDLRAVVEDACAGAGALANAKGLELELHIAGELAPLLRGDGRRIGQVLANLLSNAVKFTATGSIGVALTTAPADGGQTLARVEVTDSGIGIEPDRIERMFEPFMQADVSTTRVYGGTGLGLAISREMIELMGGAIGAGSVPGRGSTFWFEVPLAATIGAGAPAPEPAAAADTHDGWKRPPLVLVAEDNPVNQVVVARVLERCGTRVTVVADGEKALEALARRRFDAVLMDCQMPGMDGYEATRELRRRESGRRHTPVIAMTAHAMAGDREHCIEAGMDDYVTKPVRHAEISAALRRWVPDEPAAPLIDEPFRVRTHGHRPPYADTRRTR
jgi:PAS domain S-box-containing protein